MGLSKDMEFITMFNGYNALPTHMIADDTLDFSTLNYRLQTSINKGTPRWSQRSYASLFEFGTNGLIYLTEEGSLNNHSLLAEDWRASLMAKTIELIQDNDLPLVPVFAQWDMEDYNLKVPPISYLLGADKEKLPGLYFFHAATQRGVRYPLPLDDVEKVSPSLVLDWTYMAELQLTLQSYQQQLAYEPPKGDDGEDESPEQTEEYKEMLRSYIQELEKSLAEAVK